MKIAIIGYGKMGRTIEKIATKEKIEVVCIIDKEMQKGDIEFSISRGVLKSTKAWGFRT